MSHSPPPLVPPLVLAALCLALTACHRTDPSPPTAPAARYQGKTAAQWIDRLQDKAPRPQIAAARALAALAENDPKALAALRDNTNDAATIGVALITDQALWKYGSQTDRDHAADEYQMLLESDDHTLHQLVRQTLPPQIVSQWIDRYIQNAGGDQHNLLQPIANTGPIALALLENRHPYTLKTKKALEQLKSLTLTQTPNLNP